MIARRCGKGVAACIAAGLMLGTVACNHTAAATKEPTPVSTAVVQVVQVGNGARYSASISPYTQVDLAFQSSGYVESIRQVKSAAGGMRNIDEGDWAKKGTVLAVVRQQSYKDKLDQAKAQLSRANAEYQKAKLSFDRVSALYSSQSATKPDLDSAQAQLDSTAASISGADAQVSEAKVALADCSLQAPFDGWIVKRTVDAGSFVGPASNGFTIADARTVKAIFGVPDTSVGQVRVGQRLAVYADPFPKPFTGHVTSISPAADPKSRVFSVVVAIDNANNKLKSGMIASLAIQGTVLPQKILAVPLSAVIRDPDRANGFAVMVAQQQQDGEFARLRPVQLGDVYGNVIGATGGLEPGEKVITSGVTLIKNGDKVRVIP